MIITNHAKWLVSLSLMAVILLVGSTKVHATALAVSGSRCGDGVCGSASFNFSGGSRLTGLNMTVRDTKCDANDVYIRLRIYDAYGYTDTRRRYNSDGCRAGANSWNNLSYSNERAYIQGVRVIVCVDDAGPDTCYLSGYISNPNAR